MQFNLKNYIGINQTKLRKIDQTKSRNLGKKYDELDDDI